MGPEATFGAVPNDWWRGTLGDLCAAGGGEIQTGPFGSQLHASAYVPIGVPTIMPVNIGDNRVIETGISRVLEADAERLRRHRCRPGDIVYSRRGDVERRALIRERERGWLCGTGCLRVRVGDGFAIPEYVSFMLGHPRVRAWITQHAVGATMPNLNTSILSAVPAVLPPLSEQWVIAEVLGALDDKIESNRRLAEACRELIRLELEVRTDATWSEAPVSGLARFVNGGAYTNGASGTGRMVIRIAELTKGAGGSTVYNDIDVPEDRIARPGDLLMAWSGSLGIHIWLGEEAVINQHIFKVVPDGVPPWLVFDRLERVMPEFRQIAADKATTMGHIKRHHLDDALVRVPVGPDLAELDALLGPIWSRALAADIESHTLSSLRDLLLPELLSGRLRVPVAEPAVEVTV